MGVIFSAGLGILRAFAHPARAILTDTTTAPAPAPTPTTTVVLPTPDPAPPPAPAPKASAALTGLVYVLEAAGR
jgi:hypothetical protein